MQKVIRYQCDDCGRLFYTEKECVERQWPPSNERFSLGRGL